MSNDTRDLINALRRSHDEFAGFVSSLSAADLGRQSAAAEWTVADVLSHLGSASELQLATLRSGRNDLDAAPAVWDRWNAKSPAEKAADFITSEGTLVEAWEGLSEEDVAERRFDLGFLPEPVDLLFTLRMRAGEVALHRWDVEVAFDPDATATEYLVPQVLAQLTLFAGFFGKPAGATGVVAVTTTRPDRAYALSISADGVSFAEGTAVDATTTLSLPGEALLRLSAGRLAKPPAAVQIQGALTLDDLRAVFPGY